MTQYSEQERDTITDIEALIEEQEALEREAEMRKRKLAIRTGIAGSFMAAALSICAYCISETGFTNMGEPELTINQYDEEIPIYRNQTWDTNIVIPNVVAESIDDSVAVQESCRFWNWTEDCWKIKENNTGPKPASDLKVEPAVKYVPTKDHPLATANGKGGFSLGENGSGSGLTYAFTFTRNYHGRRVGVPYKVVPEWKQTAPGRKKIQWRVTRNRIKDYRKSEDINIGRFISPVSLNSVIGKVDSYTLEFRGGRKIPVVRPKSNIWSHGLHIDNYYEIAKIEVKAGEDPQPWITKTVVDVGPEVIKKRFDTTMLTYTRAVDHLGNFGKTPNDAEDLPSPIQFKKSIN